MVESDPGILDLEVIEKEKSFNFLTPNYGTTSGTMIEFHVSHIIVGDNVTIHAFDAGKLCDGPANNDITIAPPDMIVCQVTKEVNNETIYMYVNGVRLNC